MISAHRYLLHLTFNCFTFSMNVRHTNTDWLVCSKFLQLAVECLHFCRNQEQEALMQITRCQIQKLRLLDKTDLQWTKFHSGQILVGWQDVILPISNLCSLLCLCVCVYIYTHIHAHTNTKLLYSHFQSQSSVS